MPEIQADKHLQPRGQRGGTRKKNYLGDTVNVWKIPDSPGYNLNEVFILVILILAGYELIRTGTLKQWFLGLKRKYRARRSDPSPAGAVPITKQQEQRPAGTATLEPDPEDYPTKYEFHWLAKSDGLLNRTINNLQDQVITDQWSSWARLGNVLRNHPWEHLRQIRKNPTGTKAKAVEKDKPRKGRPARAHPACEPSEQANHLSHSYGASGNIPGFGHWTNPPAPNTGSASSGVN
jgi:hypothetical protein